MNIVELAACQTFITADDYASEQAFNDLLDRVGERMIAQRARTADGGFAHPCLAVFPEMIGTFLPLINRLDMVRAAASTDDAITRVALRMLPRMAMAMMKGGVFSAKVGFLLAASDEVRRVYRQAFSRFASTYDCWVVAGSALLPRNAHGDTADSFEPLDGHVYNTSYLFAPDGHHVGAVRKVNLVPGLEDALGLSRGSPDDLLPAQTPFGKVGTLICYDGFNEAHTRKEPDFQRLVSRYDAQGVDILAQPAANPWPWDERWFFAEEGETQLRREQWLNEGLYSQLWAEPLAHIRYAVNPQLLGNVFDSRFDGRSYLFERTAEGVRVIAESARSDASLEAEEVLLRAVEIPSQVAFQRAAR